jgi:hypothetical protein
MKKKANFGLCVLVYQFGPEAVTGRDVEFYNSRFEADVHVR